MMMLMLMMTITGMTKIRKSCPQSPVYPSEFHDFGLRKTAGYCALGGLKQSDHRPVCDTWMDLKCRKASCNHHSVTGLCY